jgi:hypothetical protein
VRRGRARAGSGGASKRVCAGGWRCIGAQKGRATQRSRCGAGSDAGEPEAERRQSRARERLRRELVRRDVDELASSEYRVREQERHGLGGAGARVLESRCRYWSGS